MHATSHQTIFQTQPQPSSTAYHRILSQVKAYTQNLTHHIQKAFTDQDKTIKRKRQELQLQLIKLRQQFYTERIKIIQIQDQFQKSCEGPIRCDMDKWKQSQQFFFNTMQHYQSEIAIQTLINEKYMEKVALLKQQLKECLKGHIKEQVAEKLHSQHSLSKSKTLRSKKSSSLHSSSKLSQFKLKTQASQLTRPTQLNDHPTHKPKLKLKTPQIHTQQPQQGQTHRLPSVSQKIVRLKTDMSLPSLKRSTIVNFEQRVQNDDFNFMKPIRTVKKSPSEEAIIPQIIKMFQWQKNRIQNGEIEPDWFDKVVFNKRNFEKILGHLEKEIQHHVGKKKFPESANKVKDLVAKNLFRLKTESSTSKNRSKLDFKDKSLLSVLDKSQQFSQQLIK